MKFSILLQDTISQEWWNGELPALPDNVQLNQIQKYMFTGGDILEGATFKPSIKYVDPFYWTVDLPSDWGTPENKQLIFNISDYKLNELVLPVFNLQDSGIEMEVTHIIPLFRYKDKGEPMVVVILMGKNRKAEYGIMNVDVVAYWLRKSETYRRDNGFKYVFDYDHKIETGEDAKGRTAVQRGEWSRKLDTRFMSKKNYLPMRYLVSESGRFVTNTVGNGTLEFQFVDFKKALEAKAGGLFIPRTTEIGEHIWSVYYNWKDILNNSKVDYHKLINCTMVSCIPKVNTAFLLEKAGDIYKYKDAFSGQAVMFHYDDFNQLDKSKFKDLLEVCQSYKITLLLFFKIKMKNPANYLNDPYLLIRPGAFAEFHIMGESLGDGKNCINSYAKMAAKELIAEQNECLIGVPDFVEYIKRIVVNLKRIRTSDNGSISLSESHKIFSDLKKGNTKNCPLLYDDDDDDDAYYGLEPEPEKGEIVFRA